jgi:hypothetical protein
MSKSFAQAPKPPQLSAEVISAFERGGEGQDTRGRIPPIVENREPTNVGTTGPAAENVEGLVPTNVETGKHANDGLRVTTNPGRTEPTRRLSIDLPESWHRRFKIACTRADRKMIDEVTEFIKHRTVELENE